MLGAQKLGWALSYHQAELPAPVTAAPIGGGLIENRLEIRSTADKVFADRHAWVGRWRGGGREPGQLRAHVEIRLFIAVRNSWRGLEVSG